MLPVNVTIFIILRLKFHQKNCSKFFQFYFNLLSLPKMKINKKYRYSTFSKLVSESVPQCTQKWLIRTLRYQTASYSTVELDIVEYGRVEYVSDWSFLSTMQFRIVKDECNYLNIRSDSFYLERKCFRFLVKWNQILFQDVRRHNWKI